jgi:hypothetical protein
MFNNLNASSLSTLGHYWSRINTFYDLFLLK